MKEPPENAQSPPESPQPKSGDRRRPSLGQIVFTAAVIVALVWAVAYALSRHYFMRLPYRLLARQFPEPSGIVHHPSRDTLFLVGDEGDIAEMTRDGRIVQTGGLVKADFEGVTVNPETGLLYALMEKDHVVVELDPDDLEPLRRFKIDTRHEGRVLVPDGADGLEGIAFVPDRSHPEGGRFFVVNRGAGSDSFLAELAVPLKSSAESRSTVKTLGVQPLLAPDCSDITWYAPTRELIVLSDWENRVFYLDRKGQSSGDGFSVPGRDQEGIAFDKNGFLYIAQDSGGIIKVKHE